MLWPGLKTRLISLGPGGWVLTSIVQSSLRSVTDCAGARFQVWCLVAFLRVDVQFCLMCPLRTARLDTKRPGRHATLKRRPLSRSSNRARSAAIAIREPVGVSYRHATNPRCFLRSCRDPVPQLLAAVRYARALRLSPISTR